MSQTRIDKLAVPTRHSSHSPALVRISSEPDESCCFGGSDDSFPTFEEGGLSLETDGPGFNDLATCPTTTTATNPKLTSEVAATTHISQFVDSRIPVSKVDAYKRKLMVHIKRTRDKIRHEKEARDENIATYLQHPHQSTEAKEAFERRNQRYTEHITAYAKKLTKYESDYKRLTYLSERKKGAAAKTKPHPPPVPASPPSNNLTQNASQSEKNGGDLIKTANREALLDKDLSQNKARNKDMNSFKKYGSLDDIDHKDQAMAHSSNDENAAETKSNKSIPRHKQIPSEPSDKQLGAIKDSSTFRNDEYKRTSTRSKASSSASLASSNSVPAKPSSTVTKNAHTDSPKNYPPGYSNRILNPVINIDSNHTIIPDQSSSPSDLRHSSPKNDDLTHDTDPTSPKEIIREKTSSSDRESDIKSQYEKPTSPIKLNDVDTYYDAGTVIKTSSLKGQSQSHSSLNAEFEKIIQLQNQDRRNLESLRIKNQQDFASFTEAISEARFRSEHLDEQVSDIIELQQSETENLRLEIKALEEKMSYQVDDRTQDILEMMENIQTRISKLELAQQRQQIVSLEGIEMSAARNLLLKSINILLAFLQLILLITSTFAQILSPFIKTRSRTLITLLISIIIAIILKSHPNVQRQVSAIALKIFHSIIPSAHK